MGRSIGRKSTEDDPLARATAPPANESAEARAERLREEAIAKKRSDEIDARIAAENSLRRKKGSPVKLLLLGQSESGKSTTLKSTFPPFSLLALSTEIKETSADVLK